MKSEKEKLKDEISVLEKRLENNPDETIRLDKEKYKEIEIPLDKIIDEERKKHGYSKKQCDDFKEAFLADKDKVTTKAVKNLIRKEEVKKGVPKKWD